MQGDAVLALLELSVCNSKGCWHMLEDLSILAASGSIAAGGVYSWVDLLFLVGESIVTGGIYC